MDGMLETALMNLPSRPHMAMSSGTVPKIVTQNTQPNLRLLPALLKTMETATLMTMLANQPTLTAEITLNA